MRGIDFAGLVRTAARALAAGALAAGALAAGFASPGSAAPPAAADAAATELFELRVRPLLAAECYKCHGPAQQLGGLRLDSRAAALAGGKRGPALTPGDPARSLLLKMVRHSEGLPAMPPARTLDKAAISALEQWIAAGAVWPDAQAASGGLLWSLQPVRAVTPPAAPWPERVRNPIDAFLFARLHSRGFSPAPPAAPRELVRRLYFDLTGLPPTAAETAAFLADPSEPAYRRLVERLLASPRYGERWARYWLDLVRYADSSGYERDPEKTGSWRYRDYVIRAFNEDLPYDRFILEQLAGDELPDSSLRTWIATGFLRLGTWDDEPNDPLEYRYERLDDLVHASSTAFLGLTVRCARCHDHKFDPISQRDYYAYAAAFHGGCLDAGEREHLGGPPPQKLPYPVLAFTDQGPAPPDLHPLINGDPRRPEKEPAPPGFLSAIGDLGHRVRPAAAGAATSGRRLQLARWIADPRNPLTARVMVNRIWQGHFGEALVASVNNWGRTGNTPAHPDLLDWLAGRLMRGTAVEGEPAKPWSIKQLHRLILLSSSYRMASRHPKEAEYLQKDAGNLLLWRQNSRRLDADALRDAMLAASGELNLQAGGPGFVSTVSSEALEGLSRKGAEWNPSPPDQQRRRTIYMFLKRAMIMPLLTAFDFGDTTQPLGRRDVTTVPTQALTLLNNEFVHNRAAALARRAAADAGARSDAQFAGLDLDRAVRALWLRALSRSPRPDEMKAAQLHLREWLSREASARQSRSRAAEAPSGAALHLRADTGIQVESDGRVREWQSLDKKRTAGAAAESARPLLKRQAFGEHPAVAFDGMGRFLTLPDQVVQSPQWTIAAVVRDASTGGGHRSILSNWNAAGNQASSLFLGLTGPGTVRLSDALPAAGRIEQPGKPIALTAVAGPTSTLLFQGRTEVGRHSGPLPPRDLRGPYVIGQQGNINGEFWHGDIAELIVYDRPLAGGELRQLWDYIEGRYRLAPPPPAPPAQLPALQSLARVLLNSNEFIYVD